MKQSLLLLLGFVAFCAGVLPSRAQNNLDYTVPLTSVIPNLKTIRSNVIFSKDDISLKTLHTVRDSTVSTSVNGQESKTTHKSHVLIGGLITYDTLTKYLGTGFFEVAATDKFREDYPNTIKYLTVYCDTFLLNKSIWLPECNVFIQAERCAFTGNTLLKTDPLPWKGTIRKYADISATTGKNGVQAGNVEIVANTSSDIKISAVGSNGEGVYLPNDVKLDFPATRPDATMDVHTCEGAGLPKRRSNSYNLSREKLDNFHYIAGIYYTNPDCSDSYNGTKVGFDKWDVNIYLDYAKSDNADKFVDNKLGKRISFTDKNPGKGGKAGNVRVSTGQGGKYDERKDDGNTGPYFDPGPVKAEHFELEFKTSGEVISSGVKFKFFHFYCIHEVENTSSTFGKVSIVENKCRKTFTFANGQDDFSKKYNNYEYSPKAAGLWQVSSNKSDYLPPQQLLQHKFVQIKNRIKDWNRLDKRAQDNLQAEINKLYAAIQKWHDTDKRKPFERIDKIRYANVKSIESDLQWLDKNKTSILDEFGNQPGYRPTLSFNSVLTYNDKYASSDLRLFAYASNALDQTTDRRKFLELIPSLVTDLEKKLAADNEALAENTKKLDDVKKKAVALEQSLLKLQQKLIRTEDTLRIEAGRQAQKEKRWRIGMKVLATGAGVAATALGGPAAGAAAYSGVDAISGAALDASFPNKELGEISNTAFTKFNMAATLKAIQDYKFQAIQAEVADLNYKTKFAYEKVITVAEQRNEAGEVTVQEVSEMRHTIPPTYQEYLNKQAEYDKKLAKAQKWASYAQMTTDCAKDIFSITVSDQYLENAINRVVNNSPKLAALGQEVQFQARLNGELLTDLSNAVQNRYSIYGSLILNSSNRYLLEKIKADKEAFYDPMIETRLSEMRAQSLERLKWMEYQLIKVYNYQTLSEYKGGVSNYLSLYSRSWKEKGEQGFVSDMEQQYKAILNGIKGNIMRDIKSGHGQDKAGINPETNDYYGRKLILQSDAVVNKLNKEGELVIDLYNDLKDEVIRPDQANIRIIEIDMVDFKLNRTLKPGEKVYIKATLDNQGVLRKDNEFFLFHSDENIKDSWSWTIEKSSKSAVNTISNRSESSKEYEKMIRYILGAENGNSNLFTLPPAWSNLMLNATIEDGNSSDQVKIESITLNIRCDYEAVNNDDKVLDLRMSDGDPEGRLKVQYKGRLDTLSHSSYTVLDKGTEVNLTAITPVDATVEFDYWDAPRRLNLTEEQLHSATIKFFLKDNVRIQPVFKQKEKTQVLKSKAKADFVNLYDKPSLDATIVSVVPKDKLSQFELTDEEINGFIKVIDGFETHYILKEK